MLPAFALALSGIGQAARLTRANMVETYDRPYIEMARVLWLSASCRIATRYAFRPSHDPVAHHHRARFRRHARQRLPGRGGLRLAGLSRYGVAVILRKDLNAIVGTVLIISAMFLI